MKFLKILLTTVVLMTTSLETSAIAQDSPIPAPLRASQILKACINNQAETLPIPFSDVSPDHWAFKAVMTMYYCGAFRQVTPPALLKKLQPIQGQQILPKDPKSQLEKL